MRTYPLEKIKEQPQLVITLLRWHTEKSCYKAWKFQHIYTYDKLDLDDNIQQLYWPKSLIKLGWGQYSSIWQYLHNLSIALMLLMPLKIRQHF